MRPDRVINFPNGNSVLITLRIADHKLAKTSIRWLVNEPSYWMPELICRNNQS